MNELKFSKNKILILFALGLTMVSVFIWEYFFATTQGSVVINEIMYDLKGVADDKHEWMEIYNTTEGAIDIAGWKFNDGENHILMRRRQTAGRRANPSVGGFAVLADNATQFLADHPEFTGTVIDTVMNLNNSSDTLSLLNDKIVVDAANYQNGWGANGNGKTLERVNGIWQESAQDGGTPEEKIVLP